MSVELLKFLVDRIIW